MVTIRSRGQCRFAAGPADRGRSACYVRSGGGWGASGGIRLVRLLPTRAAAVRGVLVSLALEGERRRSSVPHSVAGTLLT